MGILSRRTLLRAPTGEEMITDAEFLITFLGDCGKSRADLHCDIFAIAESSL
jgi:hypothetical protein